MFCPECGAEYRDGFTHCPDCDVDLVERLAEKPNADERVFASELREVWTGDEQAECVSICSELRQAAIPFRVLQGRSQYFKDVELSFKIGVPAEYLDSAKKLIDKSRNESDVEFQDEEEAQKCAELPAEDEDGPNVVVQRESTSLKWSPDDAATEVWSEDIPDLSPMIEASLEENGIRYRTDILENGARKVFVQTEYESQAREIVHEIVDGVPPK